MNDFIQGGTRTDQLVHADWLEERGDPAAAHVREDADAPDDDDLTFPPWTFRSGGGVGGAGGVGGVAGVGGGSAE